MTQGTNYLRLAALLTLAMSFACGHSPSRTASENNSVSVGSKTLSETVLKQLQLCVEGKSEACMQAATAYAYGDEAPFDLKRAYRLLETPCEQGLALACYRRGFWEIVDEASTIAQQNAEAYYSKACTLEVEYCAQYGQLLARDRKNVSKARTQLKKACDAGSGRGCRALAFEYLWDAPLKKAPKEFTELSIKACVLLGGDGHECEKIVAACLLTSGDFTSCAKFPALGSQRNVSLRSRVTRSDLNKCEIEKRGEWCVAVAEALRYSDRFGAALLNESGCRFQNAIACRNLSEAHKRGIGVTQNTRKAEQSLKRMCIAREGYGCLYLGWQNYLWSKYADKPTFEQALVWSQLGCAAFNKRACNNMGYLKIQVDPRGNYNKEYRQACLLDRSVACDNIAIHFDNANEPADAHFFGKRACDMGSEHWGCQIAGFQSLLKGDLVESQRLYSTGCERGHKTTCGDFAMFVENDAFNSKLPLTLRKLLSGAAYSSAADSYEEGCKNGQYNDCAKLAHALLYGEGRERDIEGAFALFERACIESGRCVELMELYANGRFVDKDVEIAMAIGERACNKFKRACEFYLGLKFRKTKNNEDKEAFKTSLEAACARGLCAYLALELIVGDAFEKDVARARSIGEHECALSGGKRCRLMAKFDLEQGEFANFKQAHRYLVNSCYTHDREACALWVDGLNEGTFMARRHELEEALGRGCLEGIETHCSEYEKRFGPARRHAALLRAQLFKKDGLVDECARGMSDRLMLYLEVDSEGNGTVGAEQLTATDLDNDIARCLIPKLEGMKFSPSPSTSPILLWIGYGVQI